MTSRNIIPSQTISRLVHLKKRLVLVAFIQSKSKFLRTLLKVASVSLLCAGVANVALASPSALPEWAAKATTTPVKSSGKPTVNAAAKLRSGPGTDYPVVGGARKGDILTVTGRNAASTWYKLSNGFWISAPLVANPPQNVAVASAPPAPTLAPTKAAVLAPTLIAPTAVPTLAPTLVPTALPTLAPTAAPTPVPAAAAPASTAVPAAGASYIIVDTSQVLASSIAGVDQMLGAPFDGFTWYPGDVEQLPAGGSERDYQVGKYQVYVLFDTAGRARGVTVQVGLSSNGYRLDKWPLILSRFGVGYTSSPDIIAPRGLHWLYANGYDIQISGQPVDSFQIYKLPY